MQSIRLRLNFGLDLIWSISQHFSQHKVCGNKPSAAAYNVMQKSVVHTYARVFILFCITTWSFKGASISIACSVDLFFYSKIMNYMDKLCSVCPESRQATN